MQPALPLHPVHAGLWSLGRLHDDFGFGDGDGEAAVAYELLQDPREIVPAGLFPLSERGAGRGTDGDSALQRGTRRNGIDGAGKKCG